MEFSRKYEYTVSFTLANGQLVSFTNPTEVSLPERKTEVIKRYNNKLGKQLSIPGKLSFSDLTVKGTLEVVGGDSVSNLATAIKELECMANNDSDTVIVNVNLYHLETSGPVTDYTLVCQDCLLTSVKIDDLARNQDDSMCNVTLVFSPGFVKTVSGPAIPA